MYDERISCSSSRSSMRPWRSIAIAQIPSVANRGPASPPLHINVRAPCVLLDELPARLHLVAHQHREELLRGRGVLGGDPLQHTSLRVHRGLPELLVVHLAEPLEAAERDAIAAELHHRAA